jgi:hypothetical protein
MTVTKLQNTDLTYVSPFSPVLDPFLTEIKVPQGKLD